MAFIDIRYQQQKYIPLLQKVPDGFILFYFFIDY
jgi:hypothetical protein